MTTPTPVVQWRPPPEVEHPTFANLRLDPAFNSGRALLPGGRFAVYGREPSDCQRAAVATALDIPYAETPEEPSKRLARGGRSAFGFWQEWHIWAAERGTEIAFLGVDTDDPTDAAETFLEQLPLPYPSFSDPDGEIADLLDAREFPSTAFYGSDGELRYVHRGGYASEQQLAADIRRYAG